MRRSRSGARRTSSARVEQPERAAISCESSAARRARAHLAVVAEAVVDFMLFARRGGDGEAACCCCCWWGRRGRGHAGRAHCSIFLPIFGESLVSFERSSRANDHSSTYVTERQLHVEGSRERSPTSPKKPPERAVR